MILDGIVTPGSQQIARLQPGNMASRLVQDCGQGPCVGYIRLAAGQPYCLLWNVAAWGWYRRLLSMLECNLPVAEGPTSAEVNDLCPNGFS